MNSIATIAKQCQRLSPLTIKQIAGFSTSATRAHEELPKEKDIAAADGAGAKKQKKPKSERVIEFEKKLRAKTPLGKLEEFAEHPFQEKEPLKQWPNNTNPHTGEVGGPAGPEPTRYGDWERKGRVTDF